MSVARFCDKNGNFDMGKLAAVVSFEKESIFNGRDNDLWANTIPTKAQLERAEILIMKTPPRKMRMQIVEERKKAEFESRAEHRIPLSAHEAPARFAVSQPTMDTVNHSISPLTVPIKLPAHVVGRLRSASEYSDDSRLSNISPVTRKPNPEKSFNFGSPMVHSDEEEEIIEPSLYRTLCAKKLIDAELPSPEKKTFRRSSVHSSFSASPCSPLSPQLKSARRRSSTIIAAAPMLPAAFDALRSASSETTSTEMFQPSPLPGQLRKFSTDAAVKTNADSFLSLASRPSTSHSERPVSSTSGDLCTSSEQLPTKTLETISKKKETKSSHDWLQNYKCSMRKCVSPITEGWKRPDGGSIQSGRMMAIFETGFYIVGDNEALPMKTDPKSVYQISAEKRKAALVSAPVKSVIPCDQRGMFWTHSSSMQVSGKLSKKSLALKEAEMLAALATEGGPPGSPERIFQQNRSQSASSGFTFKESPYIPKKTTT